MSVGLADPEPRVRIAPVPDYSPSIEGRARPRLALLGSRKVASVLVSASASQCPAALAPGTYELYVHNVWLDQVRGDQ
jgi:hypothetical protein